MKRFFITQSYKSLLNLYTNSLWFSLNVHSSSEKSKSNTLIYTLPFWMPECLFIIIFQVICCLYNQSKLKWKDYAGLLVHWESSTERTIIKCPIKSGSLTTFCHGGSCYYLHSIFPPTPMPVIFIHNHENWLVGRPKPMTQVWTVIL